MPAPVRANIETSGKKMFRNNPAMAALAGAAILLSACSGGNGEKAEAGQCEVSTELAAAMKPHAKGEVAAFTVFDEPELMGELSFVDSDGKPANITDFKGRTVLLNLWATWCAPCREEMPALKELNATLGGEDFAVVPVSVDIGTDEKPKAFYKEMSLAPLPFYHEGKMVAFKSFQKRSLALGLPATVLIGPDGCLLGKLNGPAEWASEDAKALVTAGIGKSAN